MNDKEYLMENFIGAKYQKFISLKFSIFSFLFGGIYWAYRKMIVEAILLELLTLVITSASLMVLKSLILASILSIALVIARGFLFKPFYLKFVNKKIDKIVNNVDLDDEQMLERSRKQGGTSILVMILFWFIFGAISSVIVFAGVVKLTKDMADNILERAQDAGLEIENTIDVENEVAENKIDNTNSTKNESNKVSNSTNTTKQETSSNYKFEGKIEYDDNSKVNNYISFEPIDEFELKTNSRSENVQYIASEVSPDEQEPKNIVKIELGVVKKYTKSEKLISDIAEYYDLKDDAYSAEVNDMTWDIFGFEDDDGIHYYNATTVKNKVIVFIYDIGAEVSDDKYNDFYETFITSINANEIEEENNDDIKNTVGNKSTGNVSRSNDLYTDYVVENIFEEN